MACPARIYPLKRPLGHRLPVPRWQLGLPRCALGVRTSYIGLQVRSDTREAKLSQQKITSAIEAWLGSADGPSVFETLKQLEVGFGNTTVWVCYWADTATSGGGEPNHISLVSLFRSLCPQARQDLGVWHEQFRTPISRLETNYSGTDYLPGLAKLPDTALIEHDFATYWGAARDRIPVSAYDTLEAKPITAVYEYDAQAQVPLSEHQRFVGTNHHNIAHIRTGQFWENCREEEALAYEKKLEPTLRAGIKYLEENPKESGAVGIRYLRNEWEQPQADDRPRRDTCVTGFFASLGHLEGWARTHPSHLAIYGGALAHFKAFGDERKLRTWHEVSVLREGDVSFEYINCAPGTGVLGLLPLDATAIPEQ